MASGMPDPVPPPHCPAVPDTGSGTVGQSGFGMSASGTGHGTRVGTIAQNALARLAFLRDRQRDSARDTVRETATAPSQASVPIATSVGTAGQQASGPCNDAVEALARELANKPYYRITDWDKAMQYYRGRALHILSQEAAGKVKP